MSLEAHPGDEGSGEFSPITSELIKLYSRCSMFGGENGLALPFPGSVSDQPLFVIEAFEVISSTINNYREELLDNERRKNTEPEANFQFGRGVRKRG